MSDELLLLKAILQMTARSAFSEDEIRAIVAPKKDKEKQIIAYNLCDGTMSQADIAKEVGIDSGNFSKSVKRWESLGILFKLGDGSKVKPLHLFPITSSKAE